MLATWLAAAGLTASAHQPHDVVDFVAVSPGFATDGIVLASRYPDQNWRSSEISISTDGGVNWTAAFRGLGYLGGLSDLRLSTDFPTDGLALVTSQGDGAWITTDGAASWRQVLDDDKVLVRGAVAHDGTGPVLIVAESGVGLLRSADLGATWTPVGGPIATEEMAAFGDDVAVTGDASVFVSTDAGLTFTETALGTRTYDVAVADGAVAVALDLGVLLSVGGAAFDLLREMPDTIRVVGLSPGWPADPTIYAAQQLDAALHVSEDGGATVERFDIGIKLSDQSSEHFYSVRFSGTYAEDGVAFASMYEGLIGTRDFGRTWWQSDTRPPGVINALEVSPDYPTDGVVLVASYDAGMWVSRDGGDSYTIENDDLHLSSIYDVDTAYEADGSVVSILALNSHVVWGHAPAYVWEYNALPAEAEYTSRAAFSPNYAEDGVVLVGTRLGGMYRTVDRGETWTAVTEPFEAVSAVSFAPDATTVLIGLKSGEVRLSTDAGLTFAVAPGIEVAAEPAWIDSGPNGFLVGTGLGLFTSVDGVTFAQVSEVEGIIHQVVVAADGTRFAGVRGGGLFRSDADGPFVQVGAGLTDINSPYEYATSPDFANDGTIFASIDALLFRSRDRGETWEQVGMSEIRYEEDSQAVLPVLTSIPRQLASCQVVALVEPGGYLELAFTGNGAAVLGVTRDDLGEAEVTIDGDVVGTIAQGGVETYQVEHLRITDLEPGIHTIRVTPTGVLPVEIDAIDVLVPLAAPLPEDTGEPNVDTDGGDDTDDEVEPPDDDKGCNCASG
ncbi:MAG: hypothetical protein H0V89_10010, partial [Deltaproteobacteria bacterium]|nr:hypothetical protein [Deltaproteobacteria bacterium]